MIGYSPQFDASMKFTAHFEPMGTYSLHINENCQRNFYVNAR